MVSKLVPDLPLYICIRSNKEEATLETIMRPISPDNPV